MLASRRSVRFAEMLDRLEVSRATLYRDLLELRDRMQVPIILDRSLGAYRIDSTCERRELPGLWFSPAEIHALLSMQQLLASIDGSGILAEQIAPMRQRLLDLLESHADAAGDIARRIRILGSAPRHCNPRHFETIAAALMERRCLQITYAARGDGQISTREVSPQRLVHYRDNWYLDAWCHLRGKLRNFAVDAIQTAKTTETSAIDIDQAQLDTALDAGYGIFNGPAQHLAVLIFSPLRARWVASERWHPQQHGEFLPDGRYQLCVPYSQDPELIMDILKYGPDCEVMAPAELRTKVVGLLKAAAGRYGDE
ncbi:MAG: YafY family transcriptional regulator [Azonexaceae bacterium]|nr:YafY family transcriptional regulator [Azonexaceae bacterium]